MNDEGQSLATSTDLPPKTEPVVSPKQTAMPLKRYDPKLPQVSLFFIYQKLIYLYCTFRIIKLK